MSGLRLAGALGASAALAAGLTYLIWNYASSSRDKKRETPPEEDGGRGREGGEGDGEQRSEETPAEATGQSKPAESTGTQVLVLGLDGAGKTSLLSCIATGCLERDVEPTQGFNAVSISRDDLHVEFLEIGGKQELRQYWQRYMSRALLLVFVVDSSDSQLFSVAKRLLHELLTFDPQLPLMVLANKQDLPGACSITDLHDALSLSEVGDRRLYLIGTYVKKGEAELSSGVQDARDMIIQMVCDGR
ncbi:ADP-ribosylation factor-like protein 9 [Plectropomus leopardus]|uniref:ADP-ribosylation factor-like protein 9 n=1 Tax=Plectropomus leopardus TaxID=160734 RepID=UPI001C4B5453|nr:ADP-ribosylation factor-like protein 9 [Plectropomus leopardus]